MSNPALRITAGEIDAALAKAAPIRRGNLAAQVPEPPCDPAFEQPKPTPFPTELLPEPVRGYVESSAEAIGCDPSYVALPLLAALAGAIGNARSIRLKAGWDEPSVIWSAIVGESGSSKSPALDVALRFTRERQDRLWSIHRDETRDWQDGGSVGDPPKPERVVASDLTVEALCSLLEDNPDRMLVARDELASWLGGFNKYSRGSSDAGAWLELFNARPLTVDRKTRSTVHVRRAAVSLTGSIQPGALGRMLGVEHQENGLAARLLFAMPERVAKRWTDAEPDPTATQMMSLVFDRLFVLRGDATISGDRIPRALPLSDDGRERWIEFYDAHAEETSLRKGSRAAAWSKLEAYCARLSLLVHCVRSAIGDPELRDPELIDAESVDRAAGLVEWFGAESDRIYDLLSAGAEPDGRGDDLLGWVRKHGGSTTARELSRNVRRYRASDKAQEALDYFVALGAGRWEECPPGPKGGAPTRRFVLVGE